MEKIETKRHRENVLNIKCTLMKCPSVTQNQVNKHTMKRKNALLKAFLVAKKNWKGLH